MNTVSLRFFAVSALLVLGLSACGGAEKTADAGAGTPPETAAATPTPSPTPTPTPTPTGARAHTSEELAGIVGQIQDTRGIRLSVMSGADLSAAQDQAKAIMSQVAVEPAACMEAAVAGTAPAIAGVSTALGTSTDASVGAAAAVTLLSGPDPKLLAQDPAGRLAECATMKVTASGVTLDVTMTAVDGLGSVPGTVAYRTDTAMPDGRKQSMIIAWATAGGVLINITSAGGTSQEDAISRAGALLDQAAALVK